MKAVILAAGRGLRLKPISDNLPKTLIKIGNKTLIEYSLEILSNVGIKEVIIVIGHLGEQIKNFLGNSYCGISIKYVFNKDYLNTGTMYSLYKSKDLIDDDILLLESDLLYDPSLIKEILSSKHKDLIVVSKLTNTGDEVLVSSNDNLTISAIGKNIEKKNLVGEFIGISKLSKNYITNFLKFISNKKILEEYYEDYFIDFFKNEGHSLHHFLKDNLIWTEIDNKKDLKYAKTQILQKLNFK